MAATGPGEHLGEFIPEQFCDEGGNVYCTLKPCVSVSFAGLEAMEVRLPFSSTGTLVTVSLRGILMPIIAFMLRCVRLVVFLYFS